MPYRTPSPPEKKEPEKKPLGLFGRVFHKHEWIMKCDFPDTKKEYWSMWAKVGARGLFQKYCEVKCKTGGEYIKVKGLPISSKVNKGLYKKIFNIFQEKIDEHEDYLETLPPDVGGDIDYLYEQQDETKYNLKTYYGQKVVK